MPRPSSPRKRRKAPSYRRHSTGQAFVEIRGHRYYLGKHGTDESWAAYKLKIVEWSKEPARSPPTQGFTAARLDRLTIIDLLHGDSAGKGGYREYAERHYRKHGQPTRTFKNMDPALR